MSSTFVSSRFSHAFVGVLGEQRVEHGAGLVPVFAEYIPFLDVLGALAPGQRLGIERHMADQVEGIEVLAQFCGDNVKVQAFGLQLLDNRLFAPELSPSASGSR